jgi:hypothetical protein
MNANCPPARSGSYDVHAILREAKRVDVAAMHRVRVAVRENRLTSSAITEEHYIPAIEATGRGWVVEVNGTVVAFAVGNGASFFQAGARGRSGRPELATPTPMPTKLSDTVAKLGNEPMKPTPLPQPQQVVDARMRGLRLSQWAACWPVSP